MNPYRPLRISDKRHEARDAVRLTLDVPADMREEFKFQAGQHLPIQIERDGKKVRRTYSICSEQGAWPLEIGVRIQPGGQFSEFVANELQVGDTLDVMRPNGQFHADSSPNTDAEKRKHYLGFAAGSGITPIVSILSSLLRDEPHSRFTLFYGNRQQATTMFIDDLYDLKNRYPTRLQLHFIFSREDQEFEIASGRLDAAKTGELLEQFCAIDRIDDVYICGPDSMIKTVSEVLSDRGLGQEQIHAERFGAPRRKSAPVRPEQNPGDESATVTVVMDGHRKSFSMPRSGTNIVDAAADHGIDLPYSCKGGVCATCRTHVEKGEVEMATNYGLEPWEVEKGFVLACQCTPVSDEIELNYDKT